MFRARLRARLCCGKEGLHRAPTLVRQFGGYTHILLLFLSSTHYCPLFHPLLSEISSSSCKDLTRGSAGSKTPGVVTICGWSAAGRRPTPGLQQQLQGSCARVRRIQNARRRNHLRMVRGGAQTHTRSAAAAARILRPGPQDPNARRRHHLRMVRGGAQTHTRSATVTDLFPRPTPYLVVSYHREQDIDRFLATPFLIVLLLSAISYRSFLIFKKI